MTDTTEITNKLLALTETIDASVGSDYSDANVSSIGKWPNIPSHDHYVVRYSSSDINARIHALVMIHQLLKAEVIYFNGESYSQNDKERSDSIAAALMALTPNSEQFTTGGQRIPLIEGVDAFARINRNTGALECHLPILTGSLNSRHLDNAIVNAKYESSDLIGKWTKKIKTKSQEKEVAQIKAYFAQKIQAVLRKGIPPGINLDEVIADGKSVFTFTCNESYGTLGHMNHCAKEVADAMEPFGDVFEVIADQKSRNLKFSLKGNKEDLLAAIEQKDNQFFSALAAGNRRE